LPKIVDKEKAKKIIADEATNLFANMGYVDFKVEDLAKKCNMSKGSMYNYFNSKDDIVFFIIQNEQQRYDDEIYQKINNCDTLQEKIFALFSLCILDDNITNMRRRIYCEFVKIAMKTKNKQMISTLKNIQTKYVLWLNDILVEFTKHNKIPINNYNLSKGLLAMGESVVMFWDIPAHNHKNMLISFIKELVKILKEKR